MTRDTLALWAYTPPGAPYPLVATDYSARIEALEFTTVAPGGFGDLACILKLPDARLPRPELGLFSRVALRDGLFTCFSGEWSDPTLVLDSAHGEYMLLSALGGGVALRDDPDDAAYATATTAQGILPLNLRGAPAISRSMAISPPCCPTIPPTPLPRSTTAIPSKRSSTT